MRVCASARAREAAGRQASKQAEKAERTQILFIF